MLPLYRFRARALAGNPEYTIRVMKGYAQTYFFDRASFAFEGKRA